MKSSIARLKVGGSLGFLLHLSAHVSMLCSFVFLQNNGAMQLHGSYTIGQLHFRTCHNVNVCMIAQLDVVFVSLFCAEMYSIFFLVKGIQRGARDRERERKREGNEEENKCMS